MDQELTPNEETPKKKPEFKLRDLAPQDDAMGGAAIPSKNPPLPIPPPGFVKSPENTTSE